MWLLFLLFSTRIRYSQKDFSFTFYISHSGNVNVAWNYRKFETKPYIARIIELYPIEIPQQRYLRRYLSVFTRASLAARHINIIN